VKVWDALRSIPYGETYSYEKLAWAVGAPGGQRAVGHANGLNRIAIVIPCHRVVNKDGKLGGYGGGLWRKQILLDLERGVQGTLTLFPREAAEAR
jgi:AraC family transcriptional regulator, regulatory protein of adaptative response / methylated-DNA-[protein]-cysteine methyltransferase